ncbi:hypothetical protein [Rhodohalobacter mucosus]|uniref:Uncharacterized protein n=1 Tax=Rhodohalobacter mucosus TaxID=2079485 RepID=A0A316TNW9_9BACT|nr:hypothetical protein [Rhodohalobacter mucosus]PWN05351.1 hypothetical protein DDZ15_14890 [Rhodohalobacter mucosus]
MFDRFLHIYRTAVIGFVMAGFLSHLFLPLSGQAKKTSFTRWLSHNVVETGDENESKVRDSIRKLPDQTGDFSLLLKEASQLIASHKEVFRLSAHSGSETELPSDQNPSWLIEQWNDYHHQSSQMNGFLNESGKIFLKWHDSGNGWNSLSGFNIHLNHESESVTAISHAGAEPSSAPSPLAFGISINAP